MRRLVVGVIAAALVMGAKWPDATCSWSPDAVPVGATSTLTGLNLPDRYVVRVLPSDREPYPTGVSEGPSTFIREYLVPEPLTAYFITRGGGGSLWKFGRQLNDYHVVAICSVQVF